MYVYYVSNSTPKSVNNFHTASMCFATVSRLLLVTNRDCDYIYKLECFIINSKLKCRTLYD